MLLMHHLIAHKVWYHKCDSRGRGCYNSELTEHGGCAIWYNEMQVRFKNPLISFSHSVHKCLTCKDWVLH